MRTVGVDLAAEPARTAVAHLDWTAHAAVVRAVTLGANDATVIEAVHTADKSGIDCPFGWPEPFVAFIDAHRSGNVAVPADIAGRDWRRRLAYRATDLEVQAATGIWPLSVAADRISHTAMRCAGLLAALADQGEPVDRTGTGTVVEVYPAASLARWGLPHRGYKRPENIANLQRVVDDLQATAPWLQLGDHETLCRRSDDVLDAVVAALTARAAAQGLTTRPGSQHHPAAASEGWIALPTTSLTALAP
ncbi:DUF429 domain-containing protein [Frankia sp. AgB1.9]|uniref:DUF429 domain-containing protein n=1 Tax=unclassified Frankia TaxID=2632575 RepID=UPI0019334103|nr:MULTISPECIES: DUF429 domain-containing protein [unclassified Frankia]MBL7490358.1 DUF429 domain-containing protein [Frankia sp. AgW1.1]MBL7548468.1 DUF429 domain-containing protein [Frankia sp. AgB1.9]MBL7621358.1 DUF429 domain-containing protein [Frankia sp. AgB1.8]